MTPDEVKAIRRRLGLTQAELAAQVGVTRVTVARWESGLIGIRESAARLLKLLSTKAKARK
jgi:DNA-binding transcriptional regulator YiaG